MIDDEDWDFMAYASPQTLFGAIVLIVIAVTLIYLHNKELNKCSEKHCNAGEELALIQGNCLCVKGAK